MAKCSILLFAITLGLLQVAPSVLVADTILVGAPVPNPNESWDTQSFIPPSGTVYYFADQFSLSSDQFVTDIRVPLFGYPGFPSTPFNLSLLAAPPASNPSPLLSFDLDLPGTDPLFTLFSLPVNSVLPAGTYYLRLSTSGFVGWQLADPSHFVTTFGSVTDGIWQFNTATGVWHFESDPSFGDRAPGVFAVNGPTVPEPTTCSLIALAVAGLFMTCARKSARAICLRCHIVQTPVA
jgi:hypothetical protein